MVIVHRYSLVSGPNPGQFCLAGTGNIWIGNCRANGDVVFGQWFVNRIQGVQFHAKVEQCVSHPIVDSSLENQSPMDILNQRSGSGVVDFSNCWFQKFLALICLLSDCCSHFCKAVIGVSFPQLQFCCHEPDE